MAGTLTASGRVELFEFLTVQSASFADLFVGGTFVASGVLTTSALSSIGLLSSGGGGFAGPGGTTQLGNWYGNPGLSLNIFPSHTVNIVGVQIPRPPGARPTSYAATPMAGTGTLQANIAAQAVLQNASNHNVASYQINLNGTANANTLPRFANLAGGSMSGGAFGFSNVRLENAGTISVDPGGNFAANVGGSHSGSFTGGVGSTMFFGGLAGIGHTFTAGSGVSTLGSVTLGRGNHSVAGSFSAQSVSLAAKGTLVMSGAWSVAQFAVGDGQSFSAVDFNATPVAMTELTVTRSRLSLNAPGSSNVQTLNLTTASLGIAGELTVTGNTTMFESVTFGAGTLRLAGVTDFNGSARDLRTKVVNTGTIRWNVGDLRAIERAFENSSGGLIELRGDFNATAAPGRIVNAGQFTKTLGGGAATMNVPLDNSGTVQVNQGQLVLAAGGRQSGALVAAPVSRIELQGAVEVLPGLTTSGTVEVYASSFLLRSGATFTQTGTPLVNNFGNFTSEVGSTLNATSAFGFYAQGNVLNRGTIVAANGFVVGGPTMDNRGLIDLTQSRYSHWSGGSNSGSVVNGPAGSLSFYGAFANSGVLQNAGRVRNGGVLTLLGDGFINSGFFDNQGNVQLLAGTVLNSSGQIEHTGESFEIVAAAIVQGAGRYWQRDPARIASLTRVNGTLAAGGGIFIEGGVLTGAGTVVGNLTLGEFAQLKPGNSPGTFTVNGDLQINGNTSTPAGFGNVQIELAAGGLHDRVVVSGDASIFGSLDLVALPGFAVEDGASIVWLTAGTASVFATVRSQGLPTGFTATLSGGGRQLDFFNAAATQIATSGNVLIAEDQARSNSLTDTQNYPNLTRLDNYGSFINRVGGLTIAQVLGNAQGAVLLNPGYLYGGNFDNAGSLINRGTASLSQASHLYNSGVINNEGRIEAYNTFFNEAGGQIISSGSIQVSNGPNENRNEGQITIAGTFSTNYGFRNDGQMTIKPGASFTAGVNGAGGHYLQTAGATVVDGVLKSEQVEVNNQNSQLSGHGTIEAAQLRSFGGTRIDPGAADEVGTLTLTGALEAQAVAFFIDVAGTGLSDRMVIGGAADLIGSGMTFRLLGSYRPVIGDSFTWLTAGGGITNLNAGNWRIEYLDQGNWDLWANPNGVFDPSAAAGIGVNFGIGTVTFVPEPATWMLWLCGAAVVLRLRHRLNRLDSQSAS